MAMYMYNCVYLIYIQATTISSIPLGLLFVYSFIYISKPLWVFLMLKAERPI